MAGKISASIARGGLYVRAFRRHAFSLAVAVAGVCMVAATPAWGMLQKPALDDRSYQELVAELALRIPAHSPEWTDYNGSDPGTSLLELFDVLGMLGVNSLIDEFANVPPWAPLARDDEQYWRELGYVSMEAGLLLIAPNHVVGTDWPQLYWPQTYPGVLQQEFDSFSLYANLPEPSTLPLCLAAAAPWLVARRRGRR